MGNSILIASIHKDGIQMNDFFLKIESMGWIIQADSEGNILIKKSRENPDRYIITMIKAPIGSYAVDIELVKSEIDSLPPADLQHHLMRVIIESIKRSPECPPWKET